jgi:hypothetical protein
MRQGSGSRRSRGRSNGKRSFGQGPNRSFESNGPGVKLRGTAAQVFEKYLALARDASSSGDRIASENFYQHAEHYYRLHSAFNAERKLKTENERAEEEDRQDDAASDGSGESTAQKADKSEKAEKSDKAEKSAKADKPEKTEASDGDALSEDGEEAAAPPPKPRRRRRSAPKDSEAETSA